MAGWGTKRGRSKTSALLPSQVVPPATAAIRWLFFIGRMHSLSLLLSCSTVRIWPRVLKRIRGKISPSSPARLFSFSYPNSFYFFQSFEF